MKNSKDLHAKIMYSYQGIVNNNGGSALRYAVAMLGLPFIKSLIQLLPGIDNSILKNSSGAQAAVEIVPAFWGVFNGHWELRERRVELLKNLGVTIHALHAPYVDDGKPFQPSRKSYLENTLDLTKYDSSTLFCLYSHINLFEQITPKHEEKVLIVHPLANDPTKSEATIIQEISKTVRKVLPELRDQNIRLVIENMPWLKKKHERYTTFMGDALFFEKLMNEVNDPNYGVIFDWGHANSYARFMYDHGITHQEHQFTVETLQHFEYQNYFVTKLREKLYYAHIHFNLAHDLAARAPMLFKNFDSHHDLTHISEEEYPYYKKNMQEIVVAPHLVGMTIESIPSFFNRKKRIQRYKDSVEILNSMLQSKS